MRPVKILYLFEDLGIGGAEQLLLTTLKYLNRDKFSPVVYYIGRNGKMAKEIEEINIKVTSLNKKKRPWDIGIIFDLLKIFRKEKPHIVHTNLFYANYFGRIAAIIERIPVVVTTEHGTHAYFKKFYHHWIDYILSFFTSRIIAVSNAVKKFILENTLIPPSKITVIYNAVDFDRFDNSYRTSISQIRKSLDFSDSDFIIGCISNLAWWKGQVFLLQAFSEIAKRMANAKLCIVGRNTTGIQNQLEMFAKKNGLLENVQFLGERRDTPDLLRAFDIFVFPSLTEGLGISLLEAMYMGLPSIASNIEGISEIIKDNIDGILVKGGDSKVLIDKILMLTRNSEKMKIIGNNAREKVKRFFSPEIYIKKLESIYDELIIEYEQN